MDICEFGKDHVRPAIGGDDVAERDIGDPVHGSQPDEGPWQVLPKTHLCRLDVGMGEIFAFEQEWFARCFRERVGKTVAEIQGCPVIPLAETPPSPASGVGMFGRDWKQLDRRLFQ